MSTLPPPTATAPPDTHAGSTDTADIGKPELNPTVLWQLFWHYKTQIALIALGAALLGTPISLLMRTTVYQAETEIAIFSPIYTPPPVLIGSQISTDHWTFRYEPSEETKILKSPRVLSQVVESHNLHVKADVRRIPLLGDWVARSTNASLQPGLWGRPNWLGYSWAQANIKVATAEHPLAWLDQTLYLTVLSDTQYQLELPGQKAPLTGRVGETIQLPVANESFIFNLAEIKAAPETQFSIKFITKSEAVQELDNRLQVDHGKRFSKIFSVSIQGANPQVLVELLESTSAAYLRETLHLRRTFHSSRSAHLESELSRVQSLRTQAESRQNTFEIEAYSKLYDNLLAGVQQSRLMALYASDGAKVLEPSKLTVRPNFQWYIYAVTSFILGLLLGACMSLILYLRGKWLPR